jgi:two-component system response regulator YesN
VLPHATGEAASPGAEQRDFDVLVSDLSLPGVDGIELARRWREARPVLPILILSGSAAVPEAAAVGARWVLKPVRPSVVADLIREHLAC